MSTFRVYREHVIKFGLALIVAFGAGYLKLYYVDSFFFDAQIRLKSPTRTTGNVALISIDLSTVQSLKHIPNAIDHQNLVRILNSAGALSIVSLLNPVDIVGAPNEKADFAKTLESTPNFVFGIDKTAFKGDRSALELPPPFEKVPTAMSAVTRDLESFARDQVTRRMFLFYEGEPALELVLASKINSELRSYNDVKGNFNFFGAQQTYIDFRPAKTFPAITFSDVLENKVDLNKFRNKIIFIGTDLNLDTKEYVRTPYSRDLNAMSRLELRANLIDTLILNTSLARLPDYVSLLAAFFVGLIGLYGIFARHPSKGLLIFMVSFIGLLVFSFFLISAFGLWFGLAQPLATSFILFYLVIPYRLVRENRERLQQYRRQSELAAQVSHDIRSPLVALNMAIKGSENISDEKRALIQGATKRINDIANNLLQESKFSLSKSTTPSASKENRELVMLDDLLKSILNEKREQYAQATRIKINMGTESWGLFVRADASALARVLSNLINNAVEACCETGNIIVSISHEKDFAVIKVMDDGSGISDKILRELGKTQIESSKTGSSGSGLGVLFAKNFALSYGGALNFETAVGGGTTVKLRLPLAPSPYWFFSEKIETDNFTTLVTLDGDKNESPWPRRLHALTPEIRHVRIHSYLALIEWLGANNIKECFFLLDYELLNEANPNFGVFRQFEIADRSVLVSSQHYAKNVQTQSEYIGVKLLPKNLIEHVPISHSGNIHGYIGNRRRRMESNACKDAFDLKESL